jgi:uncharacterized membrane protein
MVTVVAIVLAMMPIVTLVACIGVCVAMHVSRPVTMSTDVGNVVGSNICNMMQMRASMGETTQQHYRAEIDTTQR